MTSSRPPGIPEPPRRRFDIGRLRPQILISITILGIIAITGMFLDMTEIAGVASAGIIALAKDVITTDGN